MTVKSAAFLAFIGVLILTLLLAADFLHALMAVLRNLLPALALLRALIYLFAGITVSVFFFVFYNRQ